MFDSLFCKHDWQVLTEKPISNLETTYSFASDQYANKSEQSLVNRVKVVYKCSECGSLHSEIF